MSTVTVERRGAIAVVTLNRPERLNAIGGTLLDDLHQALVGAEQDEAVSVILLTGAGRAFCAGDDLKEFDLQTEHNEAIERHITGIQQITKDLMFSHKLVVGAVQGFAVGGGFEWMLNCDLTVAADNLVAFFPEMDWGQFVTGGVSHLLPKAVGYQRAMELPAGGRAERAVEQDADGAAVDEQRIARIGRSRIAQKPTGSRITDRTDPTHRFRGFSTANARPHSGLSKVALRQRHEVPRGSIAPPAASRPALRTTKRSPVCSTSSA